MRLRNTQEIEAFKEAVNKCSGGVWLESVQGDKYNLKSTLSQYVALGALLSEHGNELELFCQYPHDEEYFFQFFRNYPDTL